MYCSVTKPGIMYGVQGSIADYLSVCCINKHLLREYVLLNWLSGYTVSGLVLDWKYGCNKVIT